MSNEQKITSSFYFTNYILTSSVAINLVASELHNTRYQGQYSSMSDSRRGQSIDESNDHNHHHHHNLNAQRLIDTQAGHSLMNKTMKTSFRIYYITVPGINYNNKTTATTQQTKRKPFFVFGCFLIFTTVRHVTPSNVVLFILAFSNLFQFMLKLFH